MAIANRISSAGSPDRGTVGWAWTGLMLAGLLFVPGALGFFVDELSFATGTAVMCVIALILAGAGFTRVDARDVQGAFGVAAVFIFLVVMHLLIANAIGGDPNFVVGRALFSLVLFGLIAIAVPSVCNAIMISDGRLTVIVRIICVMFACSAIFSLLGVQPPTPSLGEKPTFPYTEPSFLGFSFSGVLIFTTLRSRRITSAALILAFLVLGYALSNFTIIITCMAAAIVALPLWWIAIATFTLIIGEFSLDLTYYLDRLNFDWSTSTNLSSLVYVQGWQLLGESIRKSYGWGIGLQQLGLVYTNVPATFRINALLGRDSNLQDGGFILSKIGSELGMLAVLTVATYFYFAVRSFLKLRTMSQRKPSMADGELFARSCVVGYSVELLIRGSSYFSGTFVLLLASLFYLHRTRHDNSANQQTSAVTLS